MEPSVQAFWVPKLGNSEEEYEDAAAFSVPARRFAIADGATESSFADRWARSLVRQYTAAPPLTPPASVPLHEWLAPLQEDWRAGIQWDKLPWFAEEKARTGAFAALLGINFLRVDTAPPQFSFWNLFRPKPPAFKGLRWHALAVGDSCLFQVRNQQMVKAFPLETSAAFNDRPLLIGSNQARNQLVAQAVQFAEGDCLSGDCFLLCTDALAKWFLGQCEQGFRPWQTLAALRAQPDFTSLVNKLREERSLKNDDTTLLRFTWSATNPATPNSPNSPNSPP